MGTSSYQKIPEILRLGLSVNPTSVLDIGPGFGKYGALFREYTDVWQGRFKPSEWQTRIIGVEAFLQYIHSGHRFYYDGIINGDISDVVDRLKRVDLVLWLDGPEHMQKDEALVLLYKLYGLANKAVLVSHPNEKDPKIALAQGAANGNDYERHLSIWSPQDFQPYNPTNNGEGSAVLLRKDNSNSKPNFFPELGSNGKMFQNEKLEEILLGLGVNRREERRYDAALDAFSTILESNPKHVEAYVNIGIIHRNIGKRGLAATYFNRALKLKPDHAFAIRNLEMLAK